MREKLFISLLTGGLAYIIVVLFGLLSGNSLDWILHRGLISLLIFFLFGFLLGALPDIFSAKKEQEEDIDIKEVENRLNNAIAVNSDEETATRQQEAEDTDRSSSTEEDFSPLNPPELEVNDEQ